MLGIIKNDEIMRLIFSELQSAIDRYSKSKKGQNNGL